MFRRSVPEALLAIWKADETKWIDCHLWITVRGRVTYRAYYTTCIWNKYLTFMCEFPGRRKQCTAHMQEKWKAWDYYYCAGRNHTDTRAHQAVRCAFLGHLNDSGVWMPVDLTGGEFCVGFDREKRFVRPIRVIISNVKLNIRLMWSFLRPGTIPGQIRPPDQLTVSMRSSCSIFR